MKKTKLLTGFAALALVLGLGSCEVNVDVGGDVNIGGDTTSEDSESSSEGGNASESTPEENPSENNTEEASGEGDSNVSSSDGTTILPPEGEEDITSKTIDTLIFVLTLYDEDTNEVQQCPSNGYLSYRGTFNGEDNGYWLEDGDFVTLTETTNSKGEVSYTYTFSNVLISEDHNFTLLFYYNNENFNGTYAEQKIAEGISTPVPGTTQSGDTLEFSLTCTNLANKFTAGSVTEEPEIEGGGLNPDGGDDTKGDDGSSTGPTLEDPEGDLNIDGDDDTGGLGGGLDEDLDGGSASVDPDDKNAGSTDEEDTKDDGTTGPTIDDPIGDEDIDNKGGDDEGLGGGLDEDLDGGSSTGPTLDDPIGDENIDGKGGDDGNLDGGMDADLDDGGSADLEPGIEEPIG